MAHPTNSKQKGRIPIFLVYGQTGHRPTFRFLHVEDLQATNRVHNWNIRPHRHREMYQVFFVSKGSGLASIDDRRYEIVGPALLTIPPNVVHGFEFKPPSTGIILSISEAFRQDLARLTGASDSDFAPEEVKYLPVSRSDVSRFRISRLFQDIVQEMARPATGAQSLVAARILEIFVTMSRLGGRSSKMSAREAERGYRLFEKFSRLVDNTFSDPIGIRDIARALGTTERTLRRTVAKFSGEAPVKTILNRRLTEARRLLVYSDLSIGEIAFDLQFSDASHFTRSFSKNVGVSPNAFRRNSRR